MSTIKSYRSSFKQIKKHGPSMRWKPKNLYAFAPQPIVLAPLSMTLMGVFMCYLIRFDLMTVSFIQDRKEIKVLKQPGNGAQETGLRLPQSKEKKQDDWLLKQ